MGFTEVLTIVFVVLKLLGIINWSWLLVLLPEIIAGVIYLILTVISIRNFISINKKIKEIGKDTFKF